MKREWKIPDFSDFTEDKVPGKFKWDLSAIYKNINQWEEDKKGLIKRIEGLKSLSESWTVSAEKMYDFLNAVTCIEKDIIKLYSYAALNSDTKMDRSDYVSMKGDLQNQSVRLNAFLSFVQRDIIKTGKKKIETFIGNKPELEDYSHFFRSIFRIKNHIPSVKTARISALTGHFSDTSRKASSILNNLEIPKPKISLSTGKKIRLDWTSYEQFRGSPDRRDRRKVMKKFWSNHSEFRNTNAALLNGEVKKNYFNSKIRKYDSSLKASLDSNNIDIRVYHSLLDSVKENLAPLHRYLKIKKELLGLETLGYEDLYAVSLKNFTEKLYPLSDGMEIIAESMKPLGEEYTDILEMGFSGKWIDFFPYKSKISGAYSNGMAENIHPFILMNYNGKFSSVSTLTHEMGHALHSWFSNRNQPFPKADYPIFLAEIASTFNENLLIRHIIRNESDDLMRLFILDRYIEKFRTTLYRQTLFAEFELEIHSHVEKGGTLTADWLDSKYLALTREYYGHNSGILKVEDYIANEWSSIPHFYYNFYVYQYSTGIIASGILAENVINGGKKEGERYLDFLRSGNSDYPLSTLKRAGVDLTDPSSFKLAFDHIDKLVTEFELAAIPASPSFLLS